MDPDLTGFIGSNTIVSETQLNQFPYLNYNVNSTPCALELNLPSPASKLQRGLYFTTLTPTYQALPGTIPSFNSNGFKTNPTRNWLHMYSIPMDLNQSHQGSTHYGLELKFKTNSIGGWTNLIYRLYYATRLVYQSWNPPTLPTPSPILTLLSYQLPKYQIPLH